MVGKGVLVCCMTLGHCYFFLCFSSPVRVAFLKIQKKTSFEIDKAASRLRAVTLVSAVASCMTQQLKTAKRTRIKGEPLSGGGIIQDDESSEGELY